jgi:hypothetical protein
MQKLTLTVYMPDGSTKIFEDVQGIEQQDARHVTFICAGNGDGLRSVTINLDLTIGFEIDGIIPQQSEEDDEDAPNEGED